MVTTLSSGLVCLQVDTLALRTFLQCYKCHNWLIPESLRSCLCCLVCDMCVNKPPTCPECKVPFTQDPTLSMLYLRLSSVISHPCPHVGCNLHVAPRDDHEQNCEKRPFMCFICSQIVPKHRAWSHFGSMHPTQVPLHEGVNKEVRATQFWLDNETGNNMIYCFIQERFLQITLYKFEDEQVDAQFVVNKHPSNSDVNFIIHMNFKKQEWDCQRKNNKRQWIEVPLSIVKDWLCAKCTLEVTVIMKPKRKIIRTQNAVKRKVKTKEDSN